MAGVIDFYFDFISPFSYLAHCELPGIARARGYDLAYRAVALDVIKLGGGNTGPTTREMPLKYRYSGTDMQRWARRYGVTIIRPSGYGDGPERLNKGVFFAEDRGRVEEYVTATWRRLWGEGGDMGGEGLIRDVADEFGWDADSLVAFTLSEEADDRLAASTKDAHERGVFGVPTMMIGEEMWWGNDRLEFLEEYLDAAK